MAYFSIVYIVLRRFLANNSEKANSFGSVATIRRMKRTKLTHGKKTSLTR